MDALKEVPLSAGDILDVVLPDEGLSPEYQSQLLETPGRDLLLEWPVRGSERAVLWPQQTLHLLVVKDELVHRIACTVSELRPHPKPHVLAHPVSSTRIWQRRQYYRIRTLIPLRLSGLLRGPGQQRETQGVPLDIVTHALEISGSGLVFHHGIPLPSDLVFDVRMNLEAELPPMRFEARVVYCRPLPGFDDPRLYRIALTYSTISEAQRAAIVRYVFEAQRATFGDV